MSSNRRCRVTDEINLRHSHTKSSLLWRCELGAALVRAPPLPHQIVTCATPQIGRRSRACSVQFSHTCSPLAHQIMNFAALLAAPGFRPGPLVAGATFVAKVCPIYAQPMRGMDNIYKIKYQTLQFSSANGPVCASRGTREARVLPADQRRFAAELGVLRLPSATAHREGGDLVWESGEHL
jgi:hypothetical protein